MVPVLNHLQIPRLRFGTLPGGAAGGVGTSLAVTRNEPVNGTGDGDTEPDWEVVDAHHVRLRAERSRNGGGRVYSVAITASDSSGAASTRTVVVTVPMSQGR